MANGATEDVATTARDLRMAVGRLARAIRRIYASAEDGEVSFIEVAILARLERDGPMSVSALAADEGVTGQAVSIGLRHLAELGLVSRETDPEDRRRTIMTLAQSGSASLGAREQAVEAALRSALGALDRDDLERLAAAVAALDALERQLSGRGRSWPIGATPQGGE
jgi:DNA-binding MarR family transcriptional regulator